ncbi:MAG: hypothetical protein Fur0041_22790 [Bacteroidia bacterium]
MAAQNTHTRDALVKALKKSASEIEKFQVQLALGKMEGLEAYEKTKKKLTKVIAEKKAQLKKGANDLKAAYETLEVQLALGKADTKDVFEKQQKKISTAISKVEKTVAATPGKIDEELHHEIELFKAKVDQLKIHFALGKMEAKEDYVKVKKDLFDKLAKLKAKAVGTGKSIAEKNQLRRKEIADAYKHLRKAFS